MPELTPAQFSQQVLDWFDQHGRKDLPWQHTINAYRVWISEIMLQQTQVNTVIPYFLRFMASFPTLDSLAAAPIDDVLHHWSGLGYYARARNLHKTAQTVRDQYDGNLPSSVGELCELPGIGRSTAGAICAIAYQQKAAILDGNVKRVLARYHAIEGWPGQRKTSEQLWSLATLYTPQEQVSHYTQAMMDLGATRCLRGKPLCEQCPLVQTCQAFRQGNPAAYPGKKPKKLQPVKHIQMLLIEDDAGHFLLEHRPPQGIWGGLWSFPEINSDASAQLWCEQNLAPGPAQINIYPVYRHTFSHFHLDITPVHLRLSSSVTQIMEDGRQLWYNTDQPAAIGLAAPVSKLLTAFALQKPETRNQKMRLVMTRTVFCRKYQQELEGLPRPPYPGPKGQDIYDNVSKKAWEEWTAQQTMLINERHLSMTDPKARSYLQEQMEKFLSNEDFEKAEGYVPPEN